MKNLVDYIKENSEEIQTSKDITFDFNGIDNAEDTIKQLQDLSSETGIPVSVDNQKVTISFSNGLLTQAQPIIDCLDTFIKREGKVLRRSSNEMYAQKLNRFERAMKSLKDFKNECENIEEPEPPVKNDDTKTDDEEDNKK